MAYFFLPREVGSVLVISVIIRQLCSGPLRIPMYCTWPNIFLGLFVQPCHSHLFSDIYTHYFKQCLELTRKPFISMVLIIPLFYFFLKHFPQL